MVQLIVRETNGEVKMVEMVKFNIAETSIVYTDAVGTSNNIYLGVQGASDLKALISSTNRPITMVKVLKSGTSKDLDVEVFIF